MSYDEAIITIKARKGAIPKSCQNFFPNLQSLLTPSLSLPRQTSRLSKADISFIFIFFIPPIFWHIWDIDTTAALTHPSWSRAELLSSFCYCRFSALLSPIEMNGRTFVFGDVTYYARCTLESFALYYLLSQPRHYIYRSGWLSEIFPNLKWKIIEREVNNI